MDELNTNLIIQKIKSGDRTLLNQIYQENRDAFMAFIRKNYQLEGEDAKECFQLAMMIMYENVITGKLTVLTSSLRTYLFTIGVNKAKEVLKRQVKFSHEINDYLISTDPDSPEDEKLAKERKINLVSSAMAKLGDQCKQLLKHFYYLNQSLLEIAEQLNYKNSDTVKNLKYKCLQKLRDFTNTAKGQIYE